MALNFNNLSKPSAVQTATEPRRIFAALPAKDPKYSYPRDVQTEVWNGWYERRADRDVVIKMNTGGGKTVVGLLILRSCLNENVGPAVYLAPDPHLAEQVAEEARLLGIEITNEPDSMRFRRGQAILVTSIWRLFNGLSVFGVKGAARTPVPIGAIVVDDAHACLTTAEEQFALRVPANHAAYGPLVDLFADDLERQSKPTLLEIHEGDYSAVLEIPYWAWADRQDKVLEILHPHRHDEPLKFNWPLVAESLAHSRAAVSAQGIEIKPPCPPVDQLPSFVTARRRIYLTATLADDSVLVTHFAANADGVRRPVTPSTADDLGDRMILTPLETFADADEDAIRQFAARHAQTINVVVIVPSRRRAELWQPYATATHYADTLDAGLAALRASHVGLAVLVNKYDGMDLPGDACRMLILDGLPEAQGTISRLDAAALGGSDAVLSRQVQRIEQGMGRGVRSNDDHCVVLLLGRRLTERLHPAAARAKFSPATAAQLALSDDIADQLHDQRLTELDTAVAYCLDRDPNWLQISRDALDGIEYPAGGTVSELAIAQRRAFELAQQRRYADAAAELQRVVATCDDRALRGLVKQQAAAYRHFADPVAAQTLQVSAVEDNRALLKPVAGISYTPLRGAPPQATVAAAYLAERYATGAELVLGVRGLLEALEPDPDQAAVKRFEQAVCELGRHLGFQTQRPERDVGNGPDVLWMIGELRYLVIECKSGATTDRISRHDAAQLGQSIDWFGEQYGADLTVTPVLIHPARRLYANATARASTRIITFDRLAALRRAVEQFATAVAADDQFRDGDRVGERLTAFRLGGAGFVGHWTQAPQS